MSQFTKDDFKNIVSNYKRLIELGNSPSAAAKKREMMNQLMSNESFKDIFKINTIGNPTANYKKPPSQGPKLIVMVGGPGSGKTTIRNKCLENLTQDNAVILNPDHIFTEMFDNDNEYRSTLNELFRLFYQRYLGNEDSHVASCKNIVLDRTGAYTEATEYIVKALKRFSEHNCAYEVVLCVADVDVDIAYDRTVRRSSPEGEEPGRIVPKDIVYRTHDAVDSALIKYTNNIPIQLFSSVKDAKENIEKIESNNVGYVENNTKTSYIDKGNLIIHTSNYGYITIPAGDWSFGGVMDGKPETGAFGTPVSVESITTPITANSKVSVKMGNGSILTFRNSYRLYDKIYIYDNNQEPKLVYSEEYGDVKVNENQHNDPNNRFSALSQTIPTMPKGGRKKKRKTKKKGKKNRTKNLKYKISKREKRKKSKRRNLKKRTKTVK